MNTLQLTARWDITLDSAGNMAALTGDAQIAQDVASQVRTFRGEPLFNVPQGIPYFANTLAQTPPDQLVRAQVDSAARTVPGVQTASTTLAALTGRTLSGSIAITTTSGSRINVTF